ncbi:ribosome biogenesis GTPase Der [Candidatus Peregrinibacteria bacterium]|nr:ribosome biogenesis GTPase Der [Candidatus Peregrinibacteria bacterium]
MAKLPTVAIIGRPNTGKSTLFNRMVGRNKAIVSDIPGTTRDHVAHLIKGEEIDYLLVDTGGMGGGTEDKDFEDDVHSQSLLALEHADVIILTLNSREDLTSSDLDIIQTLRAGKKNHVPIILTITKCDNPEETEEIIPQYYELGISDTIIPISAPHRLGIDNLEEELEKMLISLNFTRSSDDENESMIKVALVGKPNVGKSSIINSFMSDTQRKKSPLLVSDVPGTTRDSTDTVIRFHDEEYLFMDTAGIKRRKQTKEDVEKFAYFRSVRSVEDCDICVLVLDGSVELGRQEKRIAGMAVEAGKGLIILVNKADLLSSEEKKHVLQVLHYTFQFCRFAPVLFCSANSKEGLLKLFEQIESVKRNRERHIPTAELHRWFRDAVLGQPMGSLAKCKHITQTDDLPPTFALFVKNPKKVQVCQLRNLENNIRRTFAFDGSPIRWVTKQN